VLSPIFCLQKKRPYDMLDLRQNNKIMGGVFFMSLTDFSITKNKNIIKFSSEENTVKSALLVEYAKFGADLPPSTPVNPQFLLAEKIEFSYRFERYYAQYLAQNLLYGYSKEVVGDDEEKRKNYHRVITCLRAQLGHNVKIHKSVNHGKTFYSGLCTCGGVWVCPVCAAKIQARRTIEIQNLFQKAYKQRIDKDGNVFYTFGTQKQIIMLTLTYPHALSDKLADSLEKHAEALFVFRKTNSTNFKKFKDNVGYEGLVRGLELTYGASGWHPHTHELWVLDYWEEDAEKEQEVKEYLLKRWEHACKKVGLLTEDKVEAFRKHAVHIVFRANDSDYITKQNSANDKTWGADKEVATANSKIGKSNGKAPFQILLESEQSKKYRSLFIEYALAMKGKAQLFWTPGLKGKVGVEEKTDEQLAEEMQDNADLLALLGREHWVCVVKNKARAEILDIAEGAGIEGLIAWFADFGLVLDKPTEEELQADQQLNEKRRSDKAEKLAKRNKRKGVK
jgi:hypothetical protein